MAVPGALLAAPAIAVLALVVKLDSRGNAIFRQRRVGIHGDEFTIYKLRTMYDGQSIDGVSAGTSDPRVTRIGLLLRASKLDELPQLFNVIKGDMAIVGPRPELRKYVDHWPYDLAQVILSVRPGITDPATVVFRHEPEILARSNDPERAYINDILPQKVTHYVRYVRNRTLWGDMVIIRETIKSVHRSSVARGPETKFQ